MKSEWEVSTEKKKHMKFEKYMMTKWIVSTYKTILEVALWAFVLIGGFVGAGIGGILMNEGFLGFLLGAAVAFFGLAVFVGAVLVLEEIHSTLKEIQSKLDTPRT